MSTIHISTDLVDVSTSLIRSVFEPLAAELECPDCKEKMNKRLQDALVSWAGVKVSSCSLYLVRMFSHLPYASCSSPSDFLQWKTLISDCIIMHVCCLDLICFHSPSYSF